MFVDRAKIHVAAGNGGSGSASFRREKFVPLGGPDGGDGGNGGSVIIQAVTGEQSLVALRYQPQWKAQSGGNGRGRKMHGVNGEDCIIKVPIGTLVFDAATGDLLCDLNQADETFTAAKGGKGGLGNTHFVTSVNRAPKKFQPGTEGEEKDLDLELKTVADVGLVGYPNAGKSTLLRALSAARPKTAPYPFTTLHPSVGIIDMEDFYRFSVADIPGLIEGASENVGLGHAFLRHIERCRLFCFVLDMAGVDGRDPLADLASLRDELKKYEPGLEKRPFVLVANKMDLEGAEANLARLKEAEPNSMIIPVCAELAENTDELIRRLRKCLETLPPMDAEDLNRILAKRRVFLNDKTQAKAKDDDDWDY